MRCDQPMGLPPEAQRFLEHYLVPPDTCPTCGHCKCRQPEQVGTYSGMDEHPLHRYKLANGNCAEEFHQTTEWSSGPMMFLGLRVWLRSFTPATWMGGPVFEWSEEEIQACL